MFFRLWWVWVGLCCLFGKSAHAHLFLEYRPHFYVYFYQEKNFLFYQPCGGLEAVPPQGAQFSHSEILKNCQTAMVGRKPKEGEFHESFKLSFSSFLSSVSAVYGVPTRYFYSNINGADSDLLVQIEVAAEQKARGGKIEGPMEGLINNEVILNALERSETELLSHLRSDRVRIYQRKDHMELIQKVGVALVPTYFDGRTLYRLVYSGSALPLQEACQKSGLTGWGPISVDRAQNFLKSPEEFAYFKKFLDQSALKTFGNKFLAWEDWLESRKASDGKEAYILHADEQHYTLSFNETSLSYVQNNQSEIRRRLEADYHAIPDYAGYGKFLNLYNGKEQLSTLCVRGMFSTRPDPTSAKKKINLSFLLEKYKVSELQFRRWVVGCLELEEELREVLYGPGISEEAFHEKLKWHLECHLRLNYLDFNKHEAALAEKKRREEAERKRKEQEERLKLLARHQSDDSFIDTKFNLHNSSLLGTYTLKICNNGGYGRLRVAVAVRLSNDIEWSTHFWWYIDSNKCSNLYVGQYLGKDVYYYAETVDGRYFWGGEYSFLVKPTSNKNDGSEHAVYNAHKREKLSEDEKRIGFRPWPKNQSGTTTEPQVDL